MVEREHGGGWRPIDERDEAMTQRAGSDPGPDHVASKRSGDDAEFERQMALGRASMRKHRTVLAVLAK